MDNENISTTPPTPVVLAQLVERASKKAGRFELPPHPGGATGRISRAVYQTLKQLHCDYGEVHLCIACSGGADSLALAASLIALAPRFRHRFSAAVVDHGWRENSDKEAKQVAEYLRQLGCKDTVVLKLLADNTSERRNLGIEAEAREARYRVLSKWRKSYAKDISTFLLLGHTRDDQAESVLLGLAHGSGSGSLKGMARFDKGKGFLRPLLDIPRVDTRQMCKDCDLRYVDDPSNYPDGPIRGKDGTPLTRSALRHRVIPSMSAALGQDVRVALARSAFRMQEDEAALDWVTGTFYRRVYDEAPSKQLIAEKYPMVGTEDIRVLAEVESLAEVPQSIKNRVARLLCLDAGVPGARLKAVQIREISNSLMGLTGVGPISLPGRIQVCRIPGTRIIYFTAVGK